jgi:hypothetical protein
MAVVGGQNQNHQQGYGQQEQNYGQGQGAEYGVTGGSEFNRPHGHGGAGGVSGVPDRTYDPHPPSPHIIHPATFADPFRSHSRPGRGHLRRQ